MPVGQTLLWNGGRGGDVVLPRPFETIARISHRLGGTGVSRTRRCDGRQECLPYQGCDGRQECLPYQAYDGRQKCLPYQRCDSRQECLACRC
jgi:hypothetical protein